VNPVESIPYRIYAGQKETFVMNMAVKWIGIALLAAGTLLAQDGPRGHWTGAIELPNQSLSVEVDIDKVADAWIGAISIPAQNSIGIPLSGISQTDGKWVFHIKGGPGDPTFKGAISTDGNTLSGDFTQGDASFPFKLARSGDPKIEAAKPSPALASEFLGTWEGALETGGPTLRLILKLSNEGSESKGLLISVDQGGVEIPVSTIGQDGSKLTLDVKMVGGLFKGELAKDKSSLNGTWSQNGNDLALSLKKAK
jgi:hypothetical protein